MIQRVHSSGLRSCGFLSLLRVESKLDSLPCSKLVALPSKSTIGLHCTNHNNQFYWRSFLLTAAFKGCSSDADCAGGLVCTFAAFTQIRSCQPPSYREHSLKILAYQAVFLMCVSFKRLRYGQLYHERRLPEQYGLCLCPIFGLLE